MKNKIQCTCGQILWIKNESKIQLCSCFGELAGNFIDIEIAENGKVKLIPPPDLDLESLQMLIDLIK